MPANEDTLRRELRDAFANRAHLYRLMLAELTARLGSDEGEAALARVCEARGREVAPLLFAGLPAEPEAIGRRFLSVSPDGGDLYPHAVEAEDGRFTIAVARCPLLDAWQGSGLPDAEVARLCRVAGAFDKGLFEAAGLGFETSTWTAARGGGCCRITLKRPI